MVSPWPGHDRSQPLDDDDAGEFHSTGDPGRHGRLTVVTEGSTNPEDAAPSEHEPRPGVWRYPQVCAYWGVSRATVERWVRLYEQTGGGIPVRRDPSGRPYWLPEEASADGSWSRPRVAETALTTDDRIERARRAARRGRTG